MYLWEVNIDATPARKMTGPGAAPLFRERPDGVHGSAVNTNGVPAWRLLLLAAVSLVALGCCGRTGPSGFLAVEKGERFGAEKNSRCVLLLEARVPPLGGEEGGSGGGQQQEVPPDLRDGAQILVLKSSCFGNVTFALSAGGNFMFQRHWWRL